MTRRSDAEVRAWLHLGTDLLFDALDRLSDADFDSASGLPDWTRRHVLAHVHYNAEALRRLVRWARTGEPSRMYASAKQRVTEIESGARLSPDTLRGLVRDSARQLIDDLDALPAEAWRAEVVTAQERTVPATEIPWMRTREVAIHTVDLGVGIDFTDLPDALNEALAADALSRRLSQVGGATFARWLTGRDDRPPELGPWL